MLHSDYLADSVDAFLTTHATTDYTSPTDDIAGASMTDVHLGLTFSFPVEQTALGSGKILTWTKGFSAKNAIGNDVVKLLQDAFDRKHMHVKCVALVNDVSLQTLLVGNRRSIAPYSDSWCPFIARLHRWRMYFWRNIWNRNQRRVH